ncbi:MAG: DUF308 domain-containing protein [Odoribacteraceae bacterium]|jgi:drug/metabolite transporter (DMT)-like permease|nr:DUF308 domain-containing protein [Odoribacteraceae bacterium]
MRITHNYSFKRSFIVAIVAIALGIVLVIRPTDVLDYMVKVIGVAFCVAGVVSLLLSARSGMRSGGIFPASGVGSLALGLVLWFMSGIFTSVLIYLLGFTLFVAGAGQLAFLIAMRRVARIPALSYLSPVITLAMGVLLIANPFQAKETIVILFGATSIFWGASHLLNYRVIHRRRRANETEIVDTDYEEV